MLSLVCPFLTPVQRAARVAVWAVTSMPPAPTAAVWTPSQEPRACAAEAATAPPWSECTPLPVWLPLCKECCFIMLKLGAWPSWNRLVAVPLQYQHRGSAPAAQWLIGSSPWCRRASSRHLHVQSPCLPTSPHCCPDLPICVPGFSLGLAPGCAPRMSATTLTARSTLGASRDGASGWVRPSSGAGPSCQVSTGSWVRSCSQALE